MESTRARGFGKCTRLARVSAPFAWWVPGLGTVLALLLQVAVEEQACVPTWVVLTCGCGDEAEVDVCVQDRTGAVLTGIPCEERR